MRLPRDTMAGRRMAAGVAATAGVCLALLLIVGYTAGPMSQVELKVRHPPYERGDFCPGRRLVGGGRGRISLWPGLEGRRGFVGDQLQSRISRKVCVCSDWAASV